MRRPLRKRLTVRLAIALGLATAFILIAAGLWNLRLQRSHLTQIVVRAATERAEDIRRATREAMLRNRPGEVRRIIETVADQPSIERIRLYDKTGRICTSSDPQEIGATVNPVDEQCVGCHQSTRTLPEVDRSDRFRIFTEPDGERILGVIAPIRNEPDCTEAACHAHPASQQILGVLDLQLSLAAVDTDLAASQRQMLLSLLTTMLAVLILGWYLTWRVVLRPVGKLTQAASEVAAGNLSAHIPTSANDEIGEMTEAWNSMIAQLGRAKIVLERWSKSLEQRVQEKTRELETAHQQMLQLEKMASLGKLAAVMAHEINNPLTGIGTYASLLRRRLSRGAGDTVEPNTSLGSETEKILGMIEGEAARCGRIVRNLLLFSRTPGPSLAPTELEPLFDRCVLLLQPQADRSGVGLEIELASSLPEILCDSSQIQQLILALGLNAIEATPDGGRVAIAAQFDEPGNQVVLRVVDNGRGIPADQQHQIFEPFYTTKEEGSGVGLGLAVTYGIINRHHGTIDVESEVGVGTTITVRLPLQPSPPTGTSDTDAEKSTP